MPPDDGAVEDALGIPLHGQRSLYLRYAIESYLDGTRENLLPAMAEKLEALEKVDIEALVNYYASYKPAVITTSPADLPHQTSETRTDETGRVWLRMRTLFDQLAQAGTTTAASRPILVRKGRSLSTITASEAELGMNLELTSSAVARDIRRRWLVPLAGLLLVAGVCARSQEAPSIDEETAHIAQALELEPGLTVADVGAGRGNYTLFLADAVGPSGAVYATEVVEDLVADIRQAVAGRTNVTVILGKQDSTELPEQCCDRILLRRVFHHFEKPQSMLESLRASLRPGGMIAVVDFLRESAELGRPDATPHDHEHGVRIDQLTEHMEQAGFELVQQVEGWPSRVRQGRKTDFCLVFRRPD